VVTLDNISKLPLGFHLMDWDFYTLGESLSGNRNNYKQKLKCEL
jgi:hypothetical protein